MSRVLLPLLLLALSASAQIHTIDMTFEGVGCVPCVESMPARAQRIRGVESAKVDAAKGILSVQLAATNRVRVEQIRDIIEQDGTKAKSAVVSVSGTLERTPEGLVLLRVPQLALPFQLTGSEAILKGDTTVRVTGTISNLRATPHLGITVTAASKP